MKKMLGLSLLALLPLAAAADDKAEAKGKETGYEVHNGHFEKNTSGLKGDGPFGDTVGTGVWRSMLTEQYSKTFAKAGGVGIASEVYRTLILQQAKGQSNGPNNGPIQSASNGTNKATSQ